VHAMSKQELRTYMHAHRLVVLSTVNARGEPESALIGIAVTDEYELIFDTDQKSRKHINLLKRPRAAVTFSGPGERTVQYEGLALPVSTIDPADAAYRDVYYAAWPNARERLAWPDLVYWRLTPLWARYSCFDVESTVEEFSWEHAGF
jgi:pyridoxine/pyridoxamine 5'-phosphate oxidase